jgi:hypothetical protein
VVQFSGLGLQARDEELEIRSTSDLVLYRYIHAGIYTCMYIPRALYIVLLRSIELEVYTCRYIYAALLRRCLVLHTLLRNLNPNLNLNPSMRNKGDALKPKPNLNPSKPKPNLNPSKPKPNLNPSKPKPLHAKQGECAQT